METEIEPHCGTLSVADDDDTHVKESDELASEANAGDEDEVEEQLKAAIIEIAGGSIYAFMLDPNVPRKAHLVIPGSSFLPGSLQFFFPVKVIFLLACFVQIVGVIGIGISANNHLKEDADNQLQCTEGTNGTLTATCAPQIELSPLASTTPNLSPNEWNFDFLRVFYSPYHCVVILFLEVFLFLWVQSDIRLGYAMVAYSNLIQHKVEERANGQKSEGASDGEAARLEIEGEAAREEIDFLLIRRTGVFVRFLALLVVFANLITCIRTFEAGGTTFDAGLNALTFLIILDFDERFAWLAHSKSFVAASTKLAKLKEK